MAMTDIPLTVVPGFPFLAQPPTSIAFSSLLVLDAAGEKAALVCRVPKTGTVSKIAFRSSAVTSSGDADVRLETVDATTGDPSGTLVAANANATQTINAANTWWTTTLTASPAVTINDIVAAVIVNTTGNYQISGWNFGISGTGFPYGDHFTAAWGRAIQPVIAFEYNDGSYATIPGTYPTSLITGTSFASNSTPDERAARFQFSVAFRCVGFYVYADLDEATDVKLYDSDGNTVLRSITGLDKDIRHGNGQMGYFLYWSSAVNLSASTVYRLGIVPTTTTSIQLMEVDVPNTAQWGAWSGGAEIYSSTRTRTGDADLGTWTDNTTRRIAAGLLIDGVDVGSGGGGGPLIGGRLVG